MQKDKFEVNFVRKVDFLQDERSKQYYRFRDKYVKLISKSGEFCVDVQ